MMPTATRSPRCRRTDAASIRASRRLGTNQRHVLNAKKMAPRGAISILRCALVPVAMAALDHNDAIAMVPAAMPAMITMLAHFGAGAVAAVMAALDDDRLGTCHRRCNDRERAESCNHITKLLHDVLLQFNANENGIWARTFRRNCRRILNGCSGWLIAALLRRCWRAGGNVLAVLDRVLAALAAIIDRAQATLL